MFSHVEILKVCVHKLWTFKIEGDVLYCLVLESLIVKTNKQKTWSYPGSSFLTWKSHSC